MKRIKPFKIVFWLAVLLLFVLIGRYGFTIAKIADEEKVAQSLVFNPAAYVDGIWENKLIPAYNQKAVDLSKILTEIQPDADGTASKDSLVAIAKKYGLVTVGESHVYMVKGSGKIVNVNAETSVGTAEVTLDGYSGPIKVMLYIGTRIPSDDTSVRDAVGFITLGDFKDQTEFGKAGSEINQRIITQVLDPLDRNTLMDKTISFTGAFSIRTFNLIKINIQKINIIPVQVQLGE
jgi:predicted lipoprotein